ncbi:MAG: hypothetical protein JWP27_1654 [Flaviaesturariibacter sp.]|nr:hypothetical protein [Flaviaesturariibacter sp.]
MKPNNLRWAVIAILLACIPLAFLAIAWPHIPDTVPVRFNANMEPEKFENKSSLWLVTGITSGVSVIIYFLLVNIHRIDPKRRNQPSATFAKLGFGLVVFFAALGVILVASSLRGGLGLQRLLFPLIGLLLAFLGNYLPALKPNYFAGLRLPWTLSDPDNWRQTHRLAGRIWFWSGLAFALLAVFLPVRILLPVFITAIVAMVLVPSIYSFWLFREKKS